MYFKLISKVRFLFRSYKTYNSKATLVELEKKNLIKEYKGFFGQYGEKEKSVCGLKKILKL